MRPPNEREPLRSSRVLTTKTVLEKDRAKPTSTHVRQSLPSSSVTPARATSATTPAPTSVEPTMCTVAVAQTWRSASWRRSILSPTPKSSSVTPRSATTSSAGTDSTPATLSTNPATRKPIKGGRRTTAAAMPPSSAMTRIAVMSSMGSFLPSPTILPAGRPTHPMRVAPPVRLER